MSAGKSSEPAIRSYFFGKGYRDLKATISDSWKRNWNSASGFFDRARSSIYIILSVAWAAAGISSVIFGTIFFLVALVFHIVFLALVSALVYIAFTGLWLIERIYLAVQSYFMACPHCHAKSTIPEYRCDNCGAIHARLMPNKYGILSHLCTCGTCLPSTFFRDRGQLQARCPVCKQNIKREHVESKRIFVAIMGGPSAGKSAFLFGAVRELIEHGIPTMGYEARFFDKRSERAYNSAFRALEAGVPPDKTRDEIPRAFNLSLYRNGVLQFLLYLYDPAGEAYQATDRLAAHGFHNYVSGMVLVIDPFAIPAVQHQYARELSADASALKPSALPIEDAIDRIILAFETDYGLSKRGRVAQPLAVLVSKTDAFDLASLVGETAVDRAMAARAPDAHMINRDEVRDLLLKQQFSDWGESAFLHRIETRFHNVRYFSCSALGRMPDDKRQKFSAVNVLLPLLWIFRQTESVSFSSDTKPDETPVIPPADPVSGRSASSGWLKWSAIALLAVFVAAGAYLALNRQDWAKIAASNNAKDAVTPVALNAAGADIHARDEDGRTPLHDAAGKNAKDVAAALIAAGADIHAKKKNGWTPPARRGRE